MKGTPIISHVTPLPSNCQQGDIELMLESGASLPVHAALLRDASPFLGRILNTPAMQRYSTDPAGAATMPPLVLPTVTEPQAHALVQVLYCSTLADKLVWIEQQPLAVQHDLAVVAHALGCTVLLSLVDAVLAAHAIISPAASASLGPTKFTPDNSAALQAWAGDLGLRAFAEKAGLVLRA